MTDSFESGKDSTSDTKVSREPPHIEIPIITTGYYALDETRLNAELNAEIEKGAPKEGSTLEAMEKK